MKITFLGTGTSQGVPVIACDCPVCHSPDAHDRRLRVSVLVEVDNRVLCIDAGPDFRQQMLRADVQRLDGILLTHKHKDHIAGLDDVRAFNFKHDYDMPIWGDADTLSQVRAEFPYVFYGPYYPGIPRFDVRLLPEEPFRFMGIPIIPVALAHGRMRVWGFRVGRFAYCTDVNHIPPESMAKLRGLDVLALGALRKEAHPTHFTLAEALEVVAELKPRRAYFTHISHLMGRQAHVNPTLPQNVALAYDTLEIETPDV